jgi:DNA-binding NtrC family response regulator
MNNKTHNLFIVEDILDTAKALKKFIENKFGLFFNVIVFKNIDFALLEVDFNTSIVILNTEQKSIEGPDCFGLIKKKNPTTEVILYSGNDDTLERINLFKFRLNNDHFASKKKQRDLRNIYGRVGNIQVKLLGKEIKLSKMLAVFFMLFMSVGLIVFLFMRVF